MNHKADILNNNTILCAGATYSGTDAIGKACRALGNGILNVYRGDDLSLTVNVEKRALKSLSENDKGGLRYGKYSPMPESMKGA